MSQGIPDGLVVEDIGKSFDGTAVLKGITIHFARGKVTALLGANGAGKSTLVKIISGTYQPDAGTIRLDGRPLLDHNPRARLRDGISTINQEVALVPHMTVAENLLVGREGQAGRTYWLTSKAVLAAAERMFRESGIDADLDLRKRADQLTASEKQLVEVIKAVSRDASVILMDEPTSTLSAREVNVLFKVIDRLRNDNRVVVLISHRMDEVMALADHVVVLRDGHVVLEMPKASVTTEQIVAAMTRRQTGSIRHTSESTAGKKAPSSQVALRIQDLEIPGVTARVSVDLHEGEILGLTGPVGVGLSELGEALGGALPWQAGKVLLRGTEVKFRSPIQARRLGIAYLPEDRRTRGLILKHPILPNASLEALRRFTRWGIVARREERSAVLTGVNSVNLVYSGLGQTTSLLSGGNQQKLMFARMLLAHPQIYILVEPTAGVDIHSRHEIYQIIRQLANAGHAIMVISSDVQDITQLADRGYVLTRTQLVPIPHAQLRSESDIATLVLGG